MAQSDLVFLMIEFARLWLHYSLLFVINIELDVSQYTDNTKSSFGMLRSSNIKVHSLTNFLQA